LPIYRRNLCRYIDIFESPASILTSIWYNWRRNAIRRSLRHSPSQLFTNCGRYKLRIFIRLQLVLSGFYIRLFLEQRKADLEIC